MLLFFHIDLKTMAFLCDTGRRKLGAFLVVLVVVEIFFICLMVRHEHKSAITHALLRQEMEVRRVTPRGIDGMWKWRRDEQWEREKLSVFLVHCTCRACGKWMHHIHLYHKINCRVCLNKWHFKGIIYMHIHVRSKKNILPYYMIVSVILCIHAFCWFD